MPYRDGIGSVLQRCFDLLARIRRIEQVRVPVRTCETLFDALAWESELQKRLRELEDLAAENEPIAPAVAQARPRSHTYSPLRTLVWLMLVFATVVVFVTHFKP